MRKMTAAAVLLVLGLAGCGQGAGQQTAGASDGGQQAAADAALNWVRGTEKVRCELESSNYKWHSSSGCETKEDSTPAWSDPENYRVQRTVKWGSDAWAVVIADGENDSSPAVLGMVNENGRWVLKARGELNQIAKGSKNSECAALSGPNAPECAG